MSDEADLNKDEDQDHESSTYTGLSEAEREQIRGSLAINIETTISSGCVGRSVVRRNISKTFGLPHTNHTDPEA